MTNDWLVLLAALVFCVVMVAAVILKKKLSVRSRSRTVEKGASRYRQVHAAGSHGSNYPTEQDLRK